MRIMECKLRIYITLCLHALLMHVFGPTSNHIMLGPAHSPPLITSCLGRPGPLTNLEIATHLLQNSEI